LYLWLCNLIACGNDFAKLYALWCKSLCSWSLINEIVRSFVQKKKRSYDLIIRMMLDLELHDLMISKYLIIITYNHIHLIWWLYVIWHNVILLHYYTLLLYYMKNIINILSTWIVIWSYDKYWYYSLSLFNIHITNYMLLLNIY
jgi:hypothetical protein